MLSELALDPPSSTADLPQGERRGDCLVLSTMHSAKGLEWRVVYVLHATEGKIPLEHSFWDPDQLEEERRLFYVALTRAADWLYVCHPKHESSFFGRGWSGDFFERRELTRFVSKSVKQAFQCQQANAFKIAEVTEPSTKPRRTKRRPAKATKGSTVDG
jgi:DNA helicase-2/ATP-dependent DNA helicase PcrA